MSVLKIAARNAAHLILAASALFSVACSGEDPQLAYASTNVEADPVTVSQPVQCDSGAIQSCTIWLGRHGDLANCIHGLDICSAGEWTGCVDEETMAESPELYSALTSNGS